MAIIACKRVSNDSGGSFDHRQVVRLSNGLYGGMLSWYSLPKPYPKYQSDETEEKFFCGFLITHDRTNAELPNFSEALLTVRPKLFYDEFTGMKSKQVSLLYALNGGKLSYEEIVKGDDPDMDDFIGFPAILYVEANQKPDKNGLFGHRVKDIEPADAGLKKAVASLFKQRQIEHVGDNQLARLKFPCPAYQDELSKDEFVNQSFAAAENGDLGDDEIPF